MLFERSAPNSAVVILEPLKAGTLDDASSDLRGTFLHPDGRTERTGRGDVHVAADGVVYVVANAAPSWIRAAGVEVVVADPSGSVKAAFTINRVVREGDAFSLRS